MVTINTPRELGQKHRKGFVLSREIASVRGVKGGYLPYIKIFYNS